VPYFVVAAGEDLDARRPCGACFRVGGGSAAAAAGSSSISDAELVLAYLLESDAPDPRLTSEAIPRVAEALRFSVIPPGSEGQPPRRRSSFDQRSARNRPGQEAAGPLAAFLGSSARRRRGARVREVPSPGLRPRAVSASARPRRVRDRTLSSRIRSSSFARAIGFRAPPGGIWSRIIRVSTRRPLRRRIPRGRPARGTGPRVGSCARGRTPERIAQEIEGAPAQVNLAPGKASFRTSDRAWR